MNRRMVWLFALLIAVAMAPAAHATGWGVGGFGGVSIPIAQDDAEQGMVIGGHVKFSVGGLLGIEPNFTYFKNGDWDIDEVPDETFEGSTFNSFGVNLILGGAGPVTGFRFFPFVGVKYYNEDSELRDADSQIGWNGGLGLEIGIRNIGVEARGSFELMPLDGGGSRKWGQVTGGLNIYFGVI